MSVRRDRLRESREKKGLTQRDLAQLCGNTEFQISRYENGKNEPSATALAVIAKNLEVSTDYLLGLSHTPRGELGDTNLTEDESTVLETFRRESWPGVIRLGAERISK